MCDDEWQTAEKWLVDCGKGYHGIFRLRFRQHHSVVPD